MSQRIPKYLPLVRLVAKKYGSPDSLRGVNIIFSLHHTGDLVPLVLEMLSMGLDHELTWFFSIPYSSNSKIKSKLKDLGFKDRSFLGDSDFGPLDPYQYNQCLRARSYIPKAILNGINKMAHETIILDDGGNSSLCRFEIQHIHMEYKHKISIIEQTANGINQHRKQLMNENFTVLNIAETKAKKKHESPIIAKTIWENMKSECVKANIGLDSLNGILMLGYGDFGKSIVDQILANGIDQKKMIIKPELQNRFYIRTRYKLQPLKLSALINPIDIVIGCTGSESFHHSFISLLSSKCLLINASSWNLEFPKDDWIAAGKNTETYNGKNSSSKDKHKDLHCLLEFSIQKKQLLLPNAGYPINFTGVVNSSPPQFMQLTVALMLAGVLQSLLMNEGEFLLDKEREDFILEKYLNDIDIFNKVAYFD